MIDTIVKHRLLWMYYLKKTKHFFKEITVVQIYMNENIDGCTGHQIHTMVHRMMMYAIVCHHNSNTYRNTSSFHTRGFTGILGELVE